MTAQALGQRCSVLVAHITASVAKTKVFGHQLKGEPLTNDTIESILHSIEPKHITGVTLCGGEPLAPYNIEGMYSIISAIREHFGNTKTIWVYTGYLFEEVPDYIKDSVDYIMDGKYEKDNPTKKPFRGSDNQRMFKKAAGGWVQVD